MKWMWLFIYFSLIIKKYWSYFAASCRILDNQIPRMTENSIKTCFIYPLHNWRFWQTSTKMIFNFVWFRIQYHFWSVVWSECEVGISSAFVVHSVPSAEFLRGAGRLVCLRRARIHSSSRYMSAMISNIREEITT